MHNYGTCSEHLRTNHHTDDASISHADGASTSHAHCSVTRRTHVHPSIYC
jgi:hypothetical protein